MRHLSYSTVGPQAEQMLSGLTADHLFLAVDGLDPDVGLTTPDILEARLNSLMIRTAREVTVVADFEQVLEAESLGDRRHRRRAACDHGSES